MAIFFFSVLLFMKSGIFKKLQKFVGTRLILLEACANNKPPSEVYETKTLFNHGTGSCGVGQMETSLKNSDSSRVPYFQFRSYVSFGLSFSSHPHVFDTHYSWCSRLHHCNKSLFSRTAIWKIRPSNAVPLSLKVKVFLLLMQGFSVRCRHYTFEKVIFMTLFHALNYRTET